MITRNKIIHTYIFIYKLNCTTMYLKIVILKILKNMTRTKCISFHVQDKIIEKLDYWMENPELERKRQ